MAAGGRTYSFLPAGMALFQVFGVSFPEEVYFRGFLQERLGNTGKALLIASLLFALMHLPQLIFYGDLMAVLTFFPSLVMGYLYRRTSNVVPSAIFHAASNTVFLGFYDIL